MLQELKEFYDAYPYAFMYKGNLPGQSTNSKLNEFALIGDAYLKLQLAVRLLSRGYTNSQMTSALGKVLSNANLSELANKANLPIGNSVHANGSLLEALVGFWYNGQYVPDVAANRVHEHYGQLFEIHLINYLEQCCIEEGDDQIASLYHSASDAMDDIE